MRRQVEPWLVAALLAILVLWGISLRLQDPLSTRALGAEDPYTHVVFSKEWMEQGYFADSFHLGTELYPPGMHAFLIAFVPFTGLSFYEFARVAPAFIGGLAILGMYVLGARLAGPAAGLAAAFATAIMPEHIFRTELLFPTAFDLALLPLWLLSFHMMLSGERRAGAFLFAGAALPLAIMHPWAVPLLGAPLAIYAAVRTFRAHSSFRDSVRQLALPIGLVVGATAFSMASRWKQSDTGFADFLALLPGMAAIVTGEAQLTLVFAVIAAGLGLASILAIILVAFAGTMRTPRALRVIVSIALGAGLLAAMVPLSADPPFEVSYQAMLGPIVIVLALAGFALAFARPTPLGDMGVSVAIVLFPLTAIDLFGGPYWPQRTVAYFAIGAILLAANAAAHAHALPLLLARSERSRRVAGPAALVALTFLAAGAATAMPVNTYDWYRLYDDEQFAGFEHTARVLEERGEGSKVFVYTWQPALLVKTLAEPENVWYSPAFFQDGAKRSQQLGDATGPTYVLVDRFTLEAEDAGKAQLSFLGDGSRYRLVHDKGIRLYEVIQ